MIIVKVDNPSQIHFLVY